MAKRILQSISVFVTIVCLVVCWLPTYAFADVVEFNEAAKLGATIVDLYGMANNTSLAYDAIEQGSALTVIENLYTEYSSNASDPYTLAAIGAAAAAAGTIAVVYDAITGQGYVQFYQTQYVSSLDGFWDYTLSDLGLQRNLDGLFEWFVDQSGDVLPVTVFSDSIFTFGNLPLSVVQRNDTWPINYYANSGQRFWSLYDAYGATSDDPFLFSYAFPVSYLNNEYLIFLSDSSSGVFRIRLYDLRDPSDFVRTESFTSSTQIYTSFEGVDTPVTGFYYAQSYSCAPGTFTDAIPVTSFSPLVLPASVGVLPNSILESTTQAVVCSPSFYIGDPLTVDPVIDIPNVADPDYLPQPIIIPTNIPWDPQWGDPLPNGVSDPEPGVAYPVTDPSILNNAVPDIWADVVAGTVSVTDPDVDPDPNPDPDPSPDEVFNPLLPVTLPSFNFSFSGIWHYVREWVSSLGSWFTTLFLIWSALPYAMVVPVYATAVVVIVLGVYKRFFM